MPSHRPPVGIRRDLKGSNLVEIASGCPLSETIGDRLRVDPELAGDVGKRQSGSVQIGCFFEGLVVPDGLFATARNALAVEVAGHGGSVDAELGGELVDKGPAR